MFNWKLAQERGEDNANPLQKVAASTVHNPFLMEALLRASIAEMRRTYNLKPVVRASAEWVDRKNEYAKN